MRNRTPSLSVIVVSASLLALSQTFALTIDSASADTTAEAPALLITARNKDGTPAELSASDVNLKIEGKETPVSDLQRLSSPLRYCVIFDKSASERLRFSQQQAEAIALLEKIPQPGRDYGTLAVFNDYAYLQAEGTDPQKLARAISKEDARGGTALYDAMIACSDEMLKDAHPFDLRVLFVFSDGEDNASNSNLDRTLDILVRSGVRVYSIGHADGPRAIHALKQFAENTGGGAYFLTQKKGIENSLAEISRELAGVFSLKLPATMPLPGDHVYKIELKCSKKDVSVVAPRKYFVPSQ
jgi:Ca-activated chloride channel homolog